jgi:hypothetical protein
MAELDLMVVHTVGSSTGNTMRYMITLAVSLSWSLCTLPKVAGKIEQPIRLLRRHPQHTCYARTSSFLQEHVTHSIERQAWFIPVMLIQG